VVLVRTRRQKFKERADRRGQSMSGLIDPAHTVVLDEFRASHERAQANHGDLRRQRLGLLRRQLSLLGDIDSRPDLGSSRTGYDRRRREDYATRVAWPASFTPRFQSTRRSHPARSC
jgi:hypothetical protein